MISRQFRFIARLAFGIALVASWAVSASAQVTVTPSSINFGSVAVNLTLHSTYVTLRNNGTTTAVLTGITFSQPEYGIFTGLVSVSIPPGKSAQPDVFSFGATLPGTYNGTITFNFTGMNPVVLNVEASAFTTTAVASLSTTSLNFGTLALGATSTQSVTVTNTGGPDSVTLTAVTTYYQPFFASGFTKKVVLAPQQSFTFQVNFSPQVLGSTTGTVTLCYDVLPCNAVDLTGSGSTPAVFAMTTYPTLPAATVGFPYQASMTASGGTPPYIYRVLSGGNQVPGLTMASNGTLSGTVSSTATTGNYQFLVEVEDSSQPKRLTANEKVTVPVDPPTGANCSNIFVDVENTNTPIVNLMDLGTGTYMSEEGGLYPNGSNTDPDPHLSDGLAIGQTVQPIDGKEVLISLGESASDQPFEQFITQANADPEKNPALTIVNGAQGGATASFWTLPNSVYWDQLINYLIPEAGATPDQVVAAWVDDINSTSQTFPQNAQTLQADMEAIMGLLQQNFPNIKLAYFSSLNYSGYSLGVDSTVPEPQSYESGFGIKWAIQDQINGICCNYNPENGAVVAPWMAWSYYYWGNGLIPRSDGLTWSCQDLSPDGLHPANPVGHIKIATYLLNFFKTDPTATPWFLTPGAKARRR